MIGDYYRYVAESAGEDKIYAVKQAALKCYEEADKPPMGLIACNQIRLGLAVDISVLYYESGNIVKMGLKTQS